MHFSCGDENHRRRGENRATGKVKFATFHDLRRSCALRLAQDMLPQDLQEFMRHSSLQVTMEYYVGHRPAEVAARMWSMHTNKKRAAE